MRLNDMAAALRTRLVDDWKQLYRFYSVRMAALGMTLLTVWPQLPDDVKVLLPGWLTRLIAYVILAGIVIGAATRQNLGGKPPADGGGQ